VPVQHAAATPASLVMARVLTPAGPERPSSRSVACSCSRRFALACVAGQAQTGRVRAMAVTAGNLQRAFSYSSASWRSLKTSGTDALLKARFETVRIGDGADRARARPGE
jgi:hypothetical protein